MKPTTIDQLNQINQTFYQRVANDFHRTRQHYWPGWHQLTPMLAQAQPQSVLDVGCGNARFALYLAQEPKLTELEYLGLDNNQQLLSLAETRLGQEKLSHQLIQTDIIDRLIQGQPLIEPTNSFDLVTAFGLFHHVPSFELRQQLLTQLAQHLKPDGLMVITFWKFLDDLRLKKRVVNPLHLKLNPDELDEHDYILDWQRGPISYRYCHYIDDREEEALIDGLNLELVTRFRADGPTDQVNQYLALRKKKA
jgi:SAM-dependent methyltransferase